MSYLQHVSAGYTLRVPTFGENVRNIRARRGLTQIQLAEALDVNQGQVSNLESGESGEPKLGTLLRVACALRCSVEDLVADVDKDYEAIAGARREQNLLLRKLAALALVARNQAMHKGSLPPSILADLLRLANGIAVLDERIDAYAVTAEALPIQAAMNTELAKAAARLGMMPKPDADVAAVLSYWPKLTAKNKKFIVTALRHFAVDAPSAEQLREAAEQSPEQDSAPPATDQRSRKAGRG